MQNISSSYQNLPMCRGNPRQDFEMDLESHAKFFDRLVNLIPAKFYLPQADGERINLKYMKKSERDDARSALKHIAKEAKRKKLDPEAAKSTVELQKAASVKPATAVGPSDSDDDEEEEDERAAGGPSEKSVEAGKAATPGCGQLQLHQGIHGCTSFIVNRLQACLCCSLHMPRPS
jgi:hypothetical protein